MSAPIGEVSRTLKDALFETLSSILSPIQDVRSSAEQQISVLEVTDEFSVHLTELMLDAQAPLAIRQLASVLLKQYVESHWSINSEKFRPPETTPEAKAAVRALLPAGLQESVSKLRSSAAYAISAVAYWDWPDEWPELFDILLQSFVTENSFAVHGAMRVLKEITHDVSDTQMPQFAPVILPEMLKIFLQAEKYGVRTRGRAVEIFTTCAEIIASITPYNKVLWIGHSHDDVMMTLKKVSCYLHEAPCNNFLNILMYMSAAKTLLFPILTSFAEALVSALKVPNGMTSDSGLKKDIIHALRVLIKLFPKQMSDWLPHILQPVWNSLTESVKQYVSTAVNDSEEADNPVDSDGEVLGFENLVFSIFDFINTLIESSKYRHHVKNGMADLLYYILLFMQMTEDQIKLWSSNPDQFVEDEDDETYAYSVRISAQDLLLSLAQEFEDETAVSLCAAVTRHIHETDKNSNPHWWKVHEACMLALGSLKDLIIQKIQENCLQFDIIGFIRNVVVEDLNSTVSPFLHGRCLWFGSRYANIMDDDLTKKFLQVTISGLQATQPSSVRISGVRAVWGFCDHLKTSNKTHLLVPYLSPILEGLVCLALQFSSEVLALVLEAISIVITVDQNFTAQNESQISPLAIAVFLKQNSDPVLVRLTEQIFMELSKNPGTMVALQQRLIPTLVSILQAQPLKVPLGLQAVSLDILRTIVHSSYPLSESIITQAFPAAIHCILNSDDNTILQNGGECLRAYVSVALDQISAWHDESGQTGLDYIINVVQRVLDPKTAESASAFVGRLISLLIIKAGNVIGDKSKLLLRAVLSKMQIVEALSVNQSLIMVFAHLVNHQIEPVLDFLSGVPGPTGQSALEFVLDIWCQCHGLFYGAYEKKVSSFALSLILQYGLKNNDQRLQTIHVRGDQIFNHTDGPRTRSKTLQNPDQWTSIPVFVKIYKVLLNELSNICDQGMENQDDDESSDEDIETCENNGENSGNIDNFASTLDAALLSGIIEDEDDYEDDPDICNDPVFSVNLKAYLTDYLQQIMQLPFYNSFAEHLTASEKNFVQELVRQQTS